MKQSLYHLRVWSDIRRTVLGACPNALGLLLLGLSIGLPAHANQDILVASVLPNSRSVQVGTPATLFATILNPGMEDGTNCRIEPDPSVSGSFDYQATNPADNAPIGTRNTPVDISAGGFQTFFVVLTPDQERAPAEVELDFVCDNLALSQPITGVNTFTFSASNPAVPDVVALGATPSADGVVTLPVGTRVNVFTVASVNLGIGDALLVSAQLSNPALDASISMCQTDPLTSACINPTVPTSEPIELMVSSQATPTFGVFIASTSDVPFDPANNRIFVRFNEVDGAIRGSTSIALRTEQSVPFASDALVGTSLWSLPAQAGRLPGIVTGLVFAGDGSGTSYENIIGFRSGQAFVDISQEFSWSLADDELVIEFDNFSQTVIERIIGNYTPLVTEFGLPQAVADFFQDRFDQGLLGSELELEQRVTRRAVRLQAPAVNGTARANVTDVVRYSMDAELIRNGWSSDLPIGTPQPSEQVNDILLPAGIVAASGQVVTAGQSWALPFVFSPQDVLVDDQPAGYLVDLLEFRSDATTAMGRLSGESFSWENDGNTLVLRSGDEMHRIKTLRTIGAERLALAEYFIDGELALVSGQYIGLADPVETSLVADLIDTNTTFWQAGLNIWPATTHGPDGLVLPEFLFGYQFTSTTESSRVFGHAAGDLSCSGTITGCFILEGGPIWEWSVADRLVTRIRDDGSTIRNRGWEILSYVPGGRAVVLESAVWQFSGSPTRFVIPPRINTLELLDLSSYPEELLNSQDFN